MRDRTQIAIYGRCGAFRIRKNLFDVEEEPEHMGSKGGHNERRKGGEPVGSGWRTGGPSPLLSWRTGPGLRVPESRPQQGLNTCPCPQPKKDPCPCRGTERKRPLPAIGTDRVRARSGV